MKKTIYIVGGDLRQRTLLELLKKDKLNAFGIGLYEEDFDINSLKKADVVILPIPVSHDNIYINTPLIKTGIKISDVLSKVREDCVILGACMNDDIKQMLKEKNLKFFDYYEREELIIKNAIPTCEGTIEIALAEMPITLFDSRVLVIGYGRVGKITADRFHKLGAKVSVSARKYSDFAWIEEKGMKAVHTESLEGIIDGFDLIINTVPSVVLDGRVLEKVRGDALVIDLASKPGGVDFETARKLGKNVIWALSLPGKSAPITAGKIIKETIMNILREMEV